MLDAVAAKRARHSAINSFPMTIAPAGGETHSTRSPDLYDRPHQPSKLVIPAKAGLRRQDAGANDEVGPKGNAAGAACHPVLFFRKRHGELDSSLRWTAQAGCRSEHSRSEWPEGRAADAASNDELKKPHG
jgi:hypothetical protein